VKSGVLAFVAGVLFCAGLALSGMAQPGKVLGFLDVGGAWDASLAFVMVGGIAVYASALAFSRRLARPAFGSMFPPPPASGLDRRLLAGAALFGIGWGLSGYCPGPAVAAFAAGARAALWFTPSMLLGMWIYQRFFERAPADECSR
jgi:hypothetical protein